MDDATLDKKLADRAVQRISEGYFPGCAIGVVRRDGGRVIVATGNFTNEAGISPVATDSIYDMASVTKAIPTSCLLLKLIEDGAVGLDDRVADLIPELSTREAKNILVRHLLDFTLSYDAAEYSRQKIKYASADTILNFLFTSELAKPPGAAYFYTNATAILTGLLVERVAKTPLDVLARETFFGPLGMKNTDLRPELLPKEMIVPTELDQWRGREVRAEVHDEGAWTLRKEKDMCVGSAGLFSSVPDLLTFLEMLLHGGYLRGVRYFSDRTVEQMHTNQLATIGEYQGLGWKMERPWMGAHHSANAFGMSGFTGTAVLCDPDHDVSIAILSNGIYPTRDRAEKEEWRDKFRAEIIDMILE